MKKKRILFIASLPTKKMNFDGERNKSRDVLNALRKTDKYKFTIANFSKNKYVQMIKMLINYFLKKYDYVFISKCIVGGSYALHMLNKIRKNGNVYFYIIGNGYYGFDDKTIYFEDMKGCKHLIVESENVAESMVKKGCDRQKMSIFPCLKPTYDISPLEKKYAKEQPLKLLFFSRVNPEKGLGDLIDTIIQINEENKKVLFYLDIAGGVSNEPGIKEFNEEVIKKCNQYDYLSYLGMSLRINGLESYKRIQQYDLHVFPSRFKQECAPGAILDMFIAGVPTLSAKFPSYKGLLNEDNSFLFEQNDLNDLKNKLVDIYKNADKVLNQKRMLSFKEHYKYTDQRFIEHLCSVEFE